MVVAAGRVVDEFGFEGIDVADFGGRIDTGAVGPSELPPPSSDEHAVAALVTQRHNTTMPTERIRRDMRVTVSGDRRWAGSRVAAAAVVGPALVEVTVEELDGSRPGKVRCGLVVGSGPVGLREPVGCAVVAVELGFVTVEPQPGLEVVRVVR